MKSGTLAVDIAERLEAADRRRMEELNKEIRREDARPGRRKKQDWRRWERQRISVYFRSRALVESVRAAAEARGCAISVVVEDAVSAVFTRKRV